MGRALAALIWIMTLLSVWLFVGSGWWFPPSISEHGPAYDSQFLLTIIVVGIAFAAAQIGLGVAVWRYRDTGDGTRAVYTHGNNRVEMLGVIITAIVFIALALIHEPEVVFLDELTTGLDPQARHLMWERLQNLLQQGKAILLTTHFMDEAERLCDRLIVLDHGRKIAEGTPRKLIAEHLESDVVEVYGDGAGEAAVAHAALAERVETSGETVFFYLREPKRLLDALAANHDIRYLHRPANLEDLFLKLTGRQIRDDA